MPFASSAPMGTDWDPSSSKEVPAIKGVLSVGVSVDPEFTGPVSTWYEGFRDIGGLRTRADLRITKLSREDYEGKEELQLKH